jgi:3-oxoacyl-[acyl-carrier-protein] synthase-3
MRTDTAALLAGGLQLAKETWAAALDAGWHWTDADRYIAHQVSSVHTTKLCEVLDIDAARLPLTFPQFGNMGPAAVPYTLSTVQDDLAAGERVVLLGVGSGLNASGAELIW